MIPINSFFLRLLSLQPATDLLLWVLSGRLVIFMMPEIYATAISVSINLLSQSVTVCSTAPHVHCIIVHTCLNAPLQIAASTEL